MKMPIITKVGFLFSGVKRVEPEAEYSPLSRAKFEKVVGATDSPCKPFLRWFYSTENILPSFFGIGQNRKLYFTLSPK
jgi:hypothetical protein